MTSLVPCEDFERNLSCSVTTDCAIEADFNLSQGLFLNLNCMHFLLQRISFARIQHNSRVKSEHRQLRRINCFNISLKNMFKLGEMITINFYIEA